MASSSSSSSSSSVVGKKSNETQPQVFINFRGTELRNKFISFLVPAMREADINVFIDETQLKGEELQDLIEVEIEKSRIALAIISKEYTTSKWCLEELVKIMECRDQGSLKVIPIFYCLDISDVKYLAGSFGDNFRKLKRENLHEPVKIQKWEEALTSITPINGMSLPEQSPMSDQKFVDLIIEEVKRSLANIPVEGRSSREQVNDEGIFFVYARKLKITHVEKPKNWTWSSIYDPQSGTEVDVAMLNEVYLLRITGNFHTRKMTPGTKYEVVFMVCLDDSASGWEEPVTLKLELDHQPPQEQNLCFDDYIGADWVDIRVGEFEAPPKNAAAKIVFTLEENVVKNRKDGLMVKGVAIRPIVQVNV